MADVIDIGIANDIFLKLWQRPLSKWQSKIRWFGQSDVDYELTFLIAEFRTAAAVPVFRFENLETYFVKAVDDVAHIIATKS